MENKKFTESTESTEFNESAENVEQTEANEVNESAENAENKENSDDSKEGKEADPVADLQAQLDAQREEAFKKLLPIIDDFERAVEHNEKAEDIEALREGFKLIYGKLKTYLEQSGVSVIPAASGDAFDETIREAITMFPAPTPELKGKIVDCATKGYKYKDKVIRIAKVVVGE